MAKKKLGISKSASSPPTEPEPEEPTPPPDEGSDESDTEPEAEPEEDAGQEGELGEEYEEQGTLASGYGESGPYHCGECQHFTPAGNACTHPVVVADPALQLRRRGDAMPVDPQRGCCRYVSPPETGGPVSEQVVRP